jgi:hypothetical protein
MSYLEKIESLRSGAAQEKKVVSKDVAAASSVNDNVLDSQRVRDALRLTVEKQPSVMWSSRLKFEDMLANNKENVSSSLKEVGIAISRAEASGVVIPTDYVQGAKVEAIKKSTVDGLRDARDVLHNSWKFNKAIKKLLNNFSFIKSGEMGEVETAISTGDHELLGKLNQITAERVASVADQLEVNGEDATKEQKEEYVRRKMDADKKTEEFSHSMLTNRDALKESVEIEIAEANYSLAQLKDELTRIYQKPSRNAQMSRYAYDKLCNRLFDLGRKQRENYAKHEAATLGHSLEFQATPMSRFIRGYAGIFPIGANGVDILKTTHMNPLTGIQEKLAHPTEDAINARNFTLKVNELNDMLKKMKSLILETPIQG